MVEDHSKEGGMSPEEEIRLLEQRLEEKKRQLSEQGLAIPHEKEILREVLKEHVEGVRRTPLPETPPPAIPSASTTTYDLKKKADDLKKEEEREEKIRALIELALTRGVADAVRAAEAATPYLLDELHDHLIDDYYEKLIALRKLKAL